MAGLEPRSFTWVISKKLAVSERIGGYGFQHRRVRREEEIIWLKEAGVTAVLSLLPAQQNHKAYESAGLRTLHVPLEEEVEPEDAFAVFEVLERSLKEGSVVLVHRDLVDDTVCGLLAGYLRYGGYVDNAILATTLIQEITSRPLGPEGRRLIP